MRTIKTDMYTVANKENKTKQRKKQKQNKNITRIDTIYFFRQFGVFVFPERLFTLIDESGVI